MPCRNDPEAWFPPADPEPTPSEERAWYSSEAAQAAKDKCYDCPLFKNHECIERFGWIPDGIIAATTPEERSHLRWN